MQSVLINSASEDSNSAPVKTIKPRKPTQKSATFDAKPKSKPESELKLDTILEAKPKSKPHSAKVKSESTAAEISGGSTADINTLPEFAHSTWGTTFLLTLYDGLGCARDPFVIDVDMVKVIQEVIDLTYPDSNYQVRLGDRIFTQVSSFIVLLHFQLND